MKGDQKLDTATVEIHLCINGVVSGFMTINRFRSNGNLPHGDIDIISPRLHRSNKIGIGCGNRGTCLSIQQNGRGDGIGESRERSVVAGTPVGSTR